MDRLSQRDADDVPTATLAVLLQAPLSARTERPSKACMDLVLFGASSWI